MTIDLMTIDLMTNDVLRAKLEATERERDLFRDAWAKAQVRLDCGVDAADALRDERGGVVAWLREWQNTMDDRITHDDLDYAIAVIERGEYRREEGPHYGLKIRS